MTLPPFPEFITLFAAAYGVIGVGSLMFFVNLAAASDHPRVIESCYRYVLDITLGSGAAAIFTWFLFPHTEPMITIFIAVTGFGVILLFTSSPWLYREGDDQ